MASGDTDVHHHCYQVILYSGYTMISIYIPSSAILVLVNASGRFCTEKQNLMLLLRDPWEKESEIKTD